MIEKVFTISNKLGLHARPASAFVKTTSQYQCNFKVRKGDHEVDGKSIMGLLMLAAGPGTELQISAEGIDEEEAIAGVGRVKGGAQQAAFAAATHQRRDVEKWDRQHLGAVVDDDFPILECDE